MKRGLLLLVLATACATRVDPVVPLGYACARDAGEAQCSGGWVCGLEGRCHAPEAAAWKCESDSDCFGWHCGLGSMCESLDASTPYPCIRSQEATRHDCAPLARCGLEEVCHAEQPPQAWLCESDDDCTAPWRCAPSGRCTDPTLERVAVLATGWSVEPLTQKLFDRSPDHFADDPSFDTLAAYVFSSGAQVTHFSLTDDPVAGADAGPLHRGVVGRWTAPQSVDGLFELQSTTWVAAGGALWRLKWAADGGVLATAIDAGFAVSNLDELPGGFDFATFGVAWSGSAALLLSPDFDAVPLTVPDAGVLQGFTTVQPNNTNALVAATAQGLWFAGLDDFGNSDPWAPLETRSADGGAYLFASPAAMRSDYDNLTVLSSAGQVTEFYLDDFPVLVSRQDAPCPVCPAGLVFLGGEIATGFRGVCRDATADVQVETFDDCSSVQLSRDDRGALSRYRINSFAGAHGEIEGGRGLVLGATVALSDPTRVAGTESSGRLLIRNDDLFAEEPQVGLVSWGNHAQSSQCYGDGPTRGLPGWLDTADFGHYLERPELPLECLWAPGTPVGRTAVGPDASGQLLGLGSDEGVLLSGGLTLPAGPDAGARDAVPVGRVAPFGGVDLTDLLVVPPSSDGGVFAEGYVMGASGIASVRALTPVNWVAVPLPLGGAQPLGLLTGDGVHIRAATRDGRLYTLPSRLLISEALPANVSLASAASLGTVDFAATDAGVFFTAPNPDGGVLAVWQPLALPLSTHDPLVSSEDLPLRFIEGTGQLFIVTQWAAYRVTADAGAP